MKVEGIENIQSLFPSIWLKLHLDLNQENEELSLFLAKNCLPCDLSLQPSLWGYLLSKWTGPCLIKGNFDYEYAVNIPHAHDLITAYLLQVLCSIGRQRIDVFILPIRKEIPPSILQGIREILQQAKEEKLIRFFGILILDYSEKILTMNTLYNIADAFVVPENSRQEFRSSNIPYSSPIFFETSSLLSDLKRDNFQIISVKSMKDIYYIHQNLINQKETF